MKQQIPKCIKSTSLHKVPLHIVQVGVWYALNVNMITGPVFYADRINSERNVREVLQLGM
jgi:hypothetical protein